MHCGLLPCLAASSRLRMRRQSWQSQTVVPASLHCMACRVGSSCSAPALVTSSSTPVRRPSLARTTRHAPPPFLPCWAGEEGVAEGGADGGGSTSRVSSSHRSAGRTTTPLDIKFKWTELGWQDEDLGSPELELSPGLSRRAAAAAGHLSLHWCLV